MWANFTSIDFWATEGADGVGFMAAMFAPGAVLKAIGGANKLKGIIGGLEKGREFMSRAANVGLKMDEIGITMANTIAEAGAESGSQMEAMNENKSAYIKGYLEQNKNMSIQDAEKMFNEQKARIGRDAFVLNMGLLSGTNFVNTKMLGLAGESAVKKAAGIELRDSAGKLIEKVADRTLMDRIKAIPGKAGSMFLNEGFIEEGTQSTIENGLKNRASKGELSDSAFKDIHTTPFANEYMDMLASTDGQKAILLGGILGYGSVAVGSAKGLIRGNKTVNEAGETVRERGTEEDFKIKRVNDLLAKGREASNIYFAQTNPDIYKRTNEIDPTTGEYKFALSGGKKIVDPVKRQEFLINTQITEEQGKVWDEALERNDTRTLNELKNIAEARLIHSFIADSQDGLNILSEHLKDNTTIPEDRKQTILDKAKKVQDSHEQFLSYSKPVLNLKNDKAEPQDVEAFHQRLGLINMMNNLEITSAQEDVKRYNTTFDELLSQHGLTQASLSENESLSNKLPQMDLRFEEVMDNKRFSESRLQDIQSSMLDIWDKNKQKEAFDDYVEGRFKTREVNNEENTANAEAIATSINEAKTVEEIDEAIGKTKPVEELDIDQTIPAVTETLRPPPTVDPDTASVLNQTAENKKKEIVAENKQIVESVNQEVVAEVIEENYYEDEKGQIIDFNSGLIYNNYDDYIAKRSALTEEEAIVDETISELDKDDLTNGSANKSVPDIEVKSPADKITDTADNTNGVKSIYNTVRTIGYNQKYSNFSEHVSEGFRNFINNFKSVIGTKVYFETPTVQEYGYDPAQVKAVEIFNSKSYLNNPNDLVTLYQSYPIKVLVNEETYTFIPTIYTKTDQSSVSYQGRKDIIDGLIKGGTFDNVKSTIKFQHGGTLTYDKSVDSNGDIVVQNNITGLKEFDGNAKAVPLFFVKDEAGNLYNEQANTVDGIDDFPSILKNAYKQKGYVYTIIHSPGGIETPVKLNVRKLNRDQADMIYEVYKSLHDYNNNVSPNERLTQNVAKLSDLNDAAQMVIKNNFKDELALFKTYNDITVSDFMGLFIHDNVSHDGSTKPYTTKYQGGEIIVGQEGLLNFNDDTTMSKESFIEFLTKQKRQNTKLSYLAGENKNVNKDSYKEYLLNKVTNVNLDVNQPFKGDINVYVDSKVDVTVPIKPVETSLSNNNQNKLENTSSQQSNINEIKANQTKINNLKSEIETLENEVITPVQDTVYTPKTKASFYGASPDSNGNFPIDDVVSEFKPSMTLYSFHPIGNDLFELMYTSDRVSISDAVNYPHRYIDHMYSPKNALNQRATQLIVTKPTIMKKVGNNYTLFEKGNLYYDSITPGVSTPVNNPLLSEKRNELKQLEINQNKLENNTSTPRNSNTNSVSLLPSDGETKGINLSEFGTTKKKSRRLDNNPPKKC